MTNIVGYIAGPYRCPNKDEWNVVRNIRKAEEAALEFWRRNIPVICPHKNTSLLGGAAPDDVWLQGAIKIMLRCDFVYLIDGWGHSEGTIAEIKIAKDHGIPIFLDLNDALDWVKGESK